MDEENDPNTAPPYQPPPPFAQPYPPPPPPGYGQSPYPPPGGYTPAPDPSAAHPAVRGGYAAVLPGYPSPPPRSNRNVWILVGCLLALIVAGAATLAAVGASDDDDSPPAATHQVRVPGSFGSYERMQSAQAKQVERDIRDRFSTQSSFGAKLYAHAQLGIYAAAGQASPSIYYIGVDGKNSDAVRELLDSNSPSHNANSFLLGASVSDSDSYPAGRFGGSLKCGNAADKQPMCVWVDRSTLGVVLNVDDTVTLPELAKSTLQLRTVAEY